MVRKHIRGLPHFRIGLGTIRCIPVWGVGRMWAWLFHTDTHTHICTLNAIHMAMAHTTQHHSSAINIEYTWGLRCNKAWEGGLSQHRQAVVGYFKYILSKCGVLCVYSIHPPHTLCAAVFNSNSERARSRCRSEGEVAGFRLCVCVCFWCYTAVDTALSLLIPVLIVFAHRLP